MLARADFFSFNCLSNSNFSPNVITDFHLSDDEASQLADELKKQLLNGERIDTSEKNIQRIIAGLGDKRGLLRRTFSEYLGLIGESAIPALRIALLRSSNVITRRAAAKTFRLIGNPKALPDLLNALTNDEDPVVQASAAASMAIFGQDAAKLLQTVLADPKRSSMQHGLASWGLSFIGAAAAESIKKAAKSKNTRLRAAAIAALGDQIQSTNDKEAKDLVLSALKDQEPDVRIEATALLGKIDDPRWGSPVLRKMLNDRNQNVRKNAALSLMKLNDSDSIAELKKRAQIEENENVIKIIKLAISQIKQNS